MTTCFEGAWFTLFINICVKYNPKFKFWLSSHIYFWFTVYFVLFSYGSMRGIALQALRAPKNDQGRPPRLSFESAELVHQLQRVRLLLQYVRARAVACR